MKTTPLYSIHCRMGAKFIDFGEWFMPVQYAGIIEEHENVRKNAGLFDISHMGEILISGLNALSFIQKVITNDASKLEINQVLYSLLCNHFGGVIDDVLVYKFSNTSYMMVVNASNTEKVLKWLNDNNNLQNVDISNQSDRYALLAVQGPKAQMVLQKISSISLKDLKYYHFSKCVLCGGIEAIVSRTGYTGEDGFEIYVLPEKSVPLWEILLDKGKSDMLIPIGLGARDTLRLEASLSLYGHEISENISPIEAGLYKYVKLDKDDFIGKDALSKQKEEGFKRTVVGFEMIEKGIARGEYKVVIDNKDIGFVTSGSFSPTLKKNIGLALIEKQYSEIDSEIYIEIRNKLIKAKIIKKPFVKKEWRGYFESIN